AQQPPAHRVLPVGRVDDLLPDVVPVGGRPPRGLRRAQPADRAAQVRPVPGLPVEALVQQGQEQRDLRAGGLLSHTLPPLSPRRAAGAASVPAAVPAGPPRSGGRTLPARSTAATAPRSASAPRGRFRWSNSIATDSTAAIGLATPLPAMSGAEPWTGSNM